MKHAYLKYRNEILAILGVITPFVIGALNPLFSSNVVVNHFSINWQYYVITSLLVTIYFMYRKAKTDQYNQPLSLYADEQISFRNILDHSHSVYWYLGMGAEEFLRDIDIERYFLSRRKSDRPIQELKLLFLHPDSEFFRTRISEVNEEGDVDSIITSKKGYLVALDLALNSLSKDSLNKYEIRYYSEKPVWQLQFYDVTNKKGIERTPFGVFIRMHIPFVHSKHCKLYHCAKDDHHLFEGYLSYFDRVWKASTVSNSPGELPKL
jgi:hypothetical protein